MVGRRFKFIAAPSIEGVVVGYDPNTDIITADAFYPSGQPLDTAMEISAVEFLSYCELFPDLPKGHKQSLVPGVSCECGSDSVAGLSNHHSSWCPKAGL